MAVPETLTWDLAVGDGGPQRPSVNTMGEAALENDADYPPVAPTMPTAEMGNQWQLQLAAMGKVVAALVVSVRFSGGTPSVYKFTAPTGNLELADIVPTDNADGDTTLTWPANTLPPAVAEPCAALNGSSSGMIAAELASSVSVRVRSWNAAGSLADRDFTVTIF